MAQEWVTSEDRVVLIQVMVWILIIFCGLAVVARTGTKYAFSKSIFGFDDWTIHISVVIAVGQSVAIHLATKNGLGKPSQTLDQVQLEAVEKARYAANILFSIAFCFARLSVLGLLRLIRPGRSNDRLIYGLGIVICLWTVVGVLISALQCHPPKTWDALQGQCIDQASWLLAMDIVNAMVDMALIILPVSIIWRIQVSSTKRFSLALFFVIRITVVAALICDAAFESQLGDSNDLTLDSWASTLCTQCVQCLNIITACALYLKPFLETLQSGFIRGDDIRRRDPSMQGYASYNLSRTSKRRKSSTKNMTSSSFGTQNRIVAQEKKFRPSGGSQDSHANMIVRDTSVTVEIEPAGSQHS